MHRMTVSALPALFLSLAFLVGAAPGALAQTPQRGGAAELLAADPELEERVTELSHKLRCLVCQNQSLRLRRRADEPASALNNDQRNRARALLDGAPLPPEEPRS